MFNELNIIYQCILILILSIIISAFFVKLLIQLQNKKHLGQPIREELTFHNSKKNTPSFGGVAIFFSSILSLLIVNYAFINNKNVINLILMAFTFFLIGFIDDFTKVLFKNYKGLNGKVRFFIEILLSMFILYKFNYADKSNQYFNFFNIYLYLGVFSLIILVLVIVGTTNAMNLCDGLDALAVCLFVISLMPYIIYCFKENEIYIGLYLISIFGSCFGFVIFNMHPSKIFMGDCGSLYLGSILGIVSVYFHLEYLLLVVGIVLIMETLSVIIQVIYYKLTKKRIFLMAPLHHHFEMKGYAEEKVVLIFMIIGYFFSLIGVILIL